MNTGVGYISTLSPSLPLPSPHILSPHILALLYLSFHLSDPFRYFYSSGVLYNIFYSLSLQCFTIYVIYFYSHSSIFFFHPFSTSVSPHHLSPPCRMLVYSIQPPTFLAHPSLSPFTRPQHFAGMYLIRSKVTCLHSSSSQHHIVNTLSAADICLTLPSKPCRPYYLETSYGMNQDWKLM